jgi:hypothetical protein
MADEATIHSEALFAAPEALLHPRQANCQILGTLVTGRALEVVIV